MADKLDEAARVFVQMPPEQRGFVLVTAAFIMFTLLVLVSGFFGALVWSSVIALVLWFVDGEYHLTERFLLKQKV